MFRRIAWLGLTWLCLVPSLAGAESGKPQLGAAPHKVVAFAEVSYARPGDWNCRMEGQCLMCRNTTSSRSDVIVTHASSPDQETHPIPPEATVTSCGNVVFIPHGAEPPPEPPAE